MDLSTFERIFVGDNSWTFVFEIVFRTAVLYSFVFVLMRLMGRRSVTELSVVEILLIIALGSAVGDPMFYPDVPLLHGMAVITTVVTLNRGVSFLINRSDRIERAVEGRLARVVHEGQLDLPGFRAVEVAREEVFELLRIRGVEHLGLVRAAYLEQNGDLSVFRYAPGQERAGLPIEPPEDVEPMPHYDVGSTAPSAGPYACWSCGEIRMHEAGARIEACACEGNFRVKAALAQGQ
jgi:uncharacterized membrane protein YcaP (DUF421 family)